MKQDILFFALLSTFLPSKYTQNSSLGSENQMDMIFWPDVILPSRFSPKHMVRYVTESSNTGSNFFLRVLITCDKALWPKSTWRWKNLFHLQAYSPTSMEVRESILSRSLKKKKWCRGHGDVFFSSLTTHVLPILFCFTCPRFIAPEVGEDVPY